jgi:hypothetical protein
MKNFSDTIGNRTGSRPASGTVPPPTAPPRDQNLILVILQACGWLYNLLTMLRKLTDEVWECCYI